MFDSIRGYTFVSRLQESTARATSSPGYSGRPTEDLQSDLNKFSKIKNLVHLYIREKVVLEVAKDANDATKPHALWRKQSGRLSTGTRQMEHLLKVGENVYLYIFHMLLRICSASINTNPTIPIKVWNACRA